MSKKMKSNVMLLLTAIIWGSAFVAQKSGMDTISPVAFNGIRTLIGAVALLPVIAVMNLRRKGRPDPKTEALKALPPEERALAEKKQKKLLLI